MGKYRILIVDDEPKVAFFFQQHLELGGDGYAVTAVNSGEAALKKLAETHYDVLITDWRMPKMDGLELLKHVGQLSPKTRTILVTAYGSKMVWNQAKQMDAFAALSKPLQIPELLSVVRDALADGETQSGSVELFVLSGQHVELLTERMTELRSEVNARTIILADTSGHVLADVGDSDDLELSSMLALLGGTTAASSELTQHLNYPNPVHFSYYQGPPYDIYVATVSTNLFLTILYDCRPGVETSPIGLVWLYVRRSLAEFKELLGRKVDTGPLDTVDAGFADSVQDQLEDFFDFDTEEKEPVSSLDETAVSTLTASIASTSSSTRAKIEVALTKFSQRSKIMVERHLDPLDRSFTRTQTNLILRAVGDGLKNAYQHSQATIVGVTFQQDGEYLQGRITDNGVGFDPDNPPVQHALAQLSSDFEKENGRLSLTARLHYGTTIAFRLPME